MDRIKLNVLLTASLLAISGTTFAQLSGQPGPYMGISVGQSSFNGNSGGIENSLTAAGGIGGFSSSLDSHDTGYKLRLGYQFSRNLAMEGGYIDFGKIGYSSSYTLPVTGSASGQVKASGINFDVLGKLPLNQDTSLFGKAGLLFSRVAASASSADGSASFSTSATKLSPGLGGGLDYALSKNVGLRAEWERYFNAGNDITGKRDLDLLSVGLNFKY